MTVKLSRVAPVVGAILLLAAATPVSAQWIPFFGMFRRSPCSPVYSQPMYSPAAWQPGCGTGACGVAPVAYNPCECAPAMVAQPVTETVYRQVPVTEYRQVRQTVKKPVYETTYVDQPVTEYRQVVEQKTTCVPTVSYQNVTECQTVQRNVGSWQTQWHRNQKIRPCDYDNRPGLMGEWNRMSIATRQAFTPTTYATRQYVPQTITQQFPVTRRVAVQGQRQVSYNVARTVPTQTTRKVAVQTLKYVDEEVVAMQPVTVMKSIPSTRTTYRYVPAGTAISLGPTPDPVSEAKIVPRKSSTATRDESKSRTSDRSDEVPAKRSSFERRGTLEDEYDDGRRVDNDDSPRTPIRFVAVRGPDVARVTRVAGWRPRIAAEPVQIKRFDDTEITVAHRAK